MAFSQILPWLILLSLLAFVAWWIFKPGARSRKTDFRVITASTFLMLISGAFVFWQSGFVPNAVTFNNETGGGLGEQPGRNDSEPVVCAPGSLPREIVPIPLPESKLSVGTTATNNREVNPKNITRCPNEWPGIERMPTNPDHLLGRILTLPFGLCCAIGACISHGLQNMVETELVEFCTEPLRNHIRGEVTIPPPGSARHVYTCVDVPDSRPEWECSREYLCQPGKYCLDDSDGNGIMCNRDGPRTYEDCQKTHRPTDMSDAAYARNVCCMMAYFDERVEFDYDLLFQNCGSVASLITECLGGGPNWGTEANLGIGCGWQNADFKDNGELISGNELCDRMKNACVCND